MGSRLKVNGEAIYDSRPFVYQNDSLSKWPQVWYTVKLGNVYGISLGWPENDLLILGDIKTTTDSTIELIGYNHTTLAFKQTRDGRLKIKLPFMSSFLAACGQDCLPAFTLKFQNIGPRSPYYSN